MNAAVKLGKRKRWKYFRLPDLGRPYWLGILGSVTGRIYLHRADLHNEIVKGATLCQGGELLKVNRNRRLFRVVGYTYGGK